MSELVLRNLDTHLFEALEKKAAVHGVSVEDEVIGILNRTVGEYEPGKHSILERARAIRERNAPLQKTNTLDLLREDRKL